MEIKTIDNDIRVFYITASSFPDGVLAAHQKLHALVPFSKDRKYYGISRPENEDGIVYRAAAEEMSAGEAEKFNCETLVLKKGKYISMVVHDYMKDLQSIGKAFSQLLDYPGLDPQGYCVELYLNDQDVDCMIRLEK